MLLTLRRWTGRATCECYRGSLLLATDHAAAVGCARLATGTATAAAHVSERVCLETNRKHTSCIAARQAGWAAHNEAKLRQLRPAPLLRHMHIARNTTSCFRQLLLWGERSSICAAGGLDGGRRGSVPTNEDDIAVLLNLLERRDYFFWSQQAGWTADDEAVLQQLRPAGLLPGRPAAAGAPPLLLVANKCDLAGGAGRSGSGSPAAAEAIGSQAAEIDGSLVVAAANESRAAAVVPEAWRGAVSAVVETSAKTGDGLSALKQAVLTLTDSPQLSSGAQSSSAGSNFCSPLEFLESVPELSVDMQVYLRL